MWAGLPVPHVVEGSSGPSPPGRSQFRNVAQLGSALGWGPRGRGFKSYHSDALIPSVRLRPFREDLIAL